MRILIAIPAAFVAITMFAPAADACSVRGQYCDRPYWAANAFESPRGRVSEGAQPTSITSSTPKSSSSGSGSSGSKRRSR